MSQSVVDAILSWVDEYPIQPQSPVAVQQQAEVLLAEDKENAEMQMLRIRIGALKEDLPYTDHEMRTAITNATMIEAFTATKSADRLKALEMVGKTDKVRLFAPNRIEYADNTTEGVQQRVKDRLSKWMGDDAIDAEFSEVPSS